MNKKIYMLKKMIKSNLLGKYKWHLMFGRDKKDPLYC